jgi:hypothetical protein
MDAWLAARRDGAIARCVVPGAPTSTLGTPLRFRL